MNGFFVSSERADWDKVRMVLTAKPMRTFEIAQSAGISKAHAAGGLHYGVRHGLVRESTIKVKRERYPTYSLPIPR